MRAMLVIEKRDPNPKKLEFGFLNRPRLAMLEEFYPFGPIPMQGILRYTPKRLARHDAFVKMYKSLEESDEEELDNDNKMP